MKEGAIIHRYGAIALCETKGSISSMSPLLGFASKSQGYALRR